MAWQASPYPVILLSTAALALTVASIAFLRRGTPGSGTLALLMTVVTGWAVVNGLEVVAVALPDKILWAKLGYVGIVSVPLLWLVFVARYTQHDRGLRHRHVAVLCLVPAATLVLAATNEQHNWIWRDINLETGPLGPMAVYTHGPWFYINVIYAYAILLAAALLLARVALRSTYMVRRQAVALLVAASIPWLANLTYIAGLVPVGGLDPTLPAFAVSGLVAAASIFRFQFLDLVPTARDAILESMSDGVLVLDAKNRIVDANPAARRALGWQSAPIGQPATRALANLPDLLARYLDVAEAHSEIRLSGERETYVDLCISPLRDRRGRQTGRSIVFRDITDRKQVEAQLLQAKEALEGANRELARRLQELDVANAELQEHNEDLEAFAHTVAHDLKNPLAQIIGFAEILSGDCGVLSAAEMQASLSIIERTSFRMSSIIQELLLLAEVRQAEAQLCVLNMPAIVDNALEHVAHLTHERAATVLMSDPREWPAVVGYAPWVEQVWVNYINNALRYGGQPDATPSVQPCVELGAEAQGAGWVRFWVRDNGRGLGEQEQARLFAPFERLSQARATGHGLGLSIVRRIVEKLGGRVDVESAPGQGSLFSFTLPAATSVIQASSADATRP